MNHFKYRDNVLHCEEVPVQEIAAQIGTPFYLYSHATLTRHFQVFNEARIFCDEVTFDAFEAWWETQTDA